MITGDFKNYGDDKMSKEIKFKDKPIKLTPPKMNIKIQKPKTKESK